MKSWSFVVAGLYALVLALLTIPLLAVGFGKWPQAQQLSVFFADWPFWICLLVLAGCQLVLLTVPVRIANRRPVTRGALWPTVLVCAFMMSLLGLGAVVSIYAAVFGDNPLFAGEPWLLIFLVVVLWALWGVVFQRLGRDRPPADFVSTLCFRLVRGSILELLVAVPCHIVVRGREYCCAGMLTMFGLAMGLSVMLFAFGPAVYFLFLARARQLRPADPDSESAATPSQEP